MAKISAASTAPRKPLYSVLYVQVLCAIVLGGLLGWLAPDIAVNEWIKALGHATQIGRASSAAEAEDFLAAIDCIVGLEHRADDAQRLLTASAIHHAQDFRQLHLSGIISGKLGVAAHALKHASSILREHVLGDVIGG